MKSSSSLTKLLLQRLRRCSHNEEQLVVDKAALAKIEEVFA